MMILYQMEVYTAKNKRKIITYNLLPNKEKGRLQSCFCSRPPKHNYSVPTITTLYI